MISFKANVRSEEIILPMGIYLKKYDERFDTCVVKAMDGDDEEQISEKKIRNNGAKMVTRLLAKKIIKVGDYDYPDGVGESVVREMFSEDRDTCLVAVRKLMRDEMEIKAKCPRCNDTFEGIILMSDLLKDVSKWGDKEVHDESLPMGEINFELPDGIIMTDTEQGGKEVICRKGRMRMPTGAIEETIAASQNNMNNIGKANSLLLSGCILELENIRKIDKYVMQAMSRGDREYLSDLLTKAKCGPDLMTPITCENCDNEYKFMLQLPYFFTTGRGQQ